MAGYANSVEHVERQEEREAELRGELDELDQRGEELEGQAEKVEAEVNDAREEYEQGVESAEVPGLQDMDESVTGSPGGAQGQPVEGQDDD